MKRYGNKRDANEKEIVEALRAIGCSVYYMDKPVDLLVGYRARNFLLECKTDNGKLTKDQKAFFPEWRGQVRVVKSAEEAIRVVLDCYAPGSRRPV